MATLLEHLRNRASRGLFEMAIAQEKGQHGQPDHSVSSFSPGSSGSSRTYTLSELSGRHWQRFKRYKFKRLGQFSRNRAQLEKLYRDLGKVFFCFPTGVRDILMGNNRTAIVFIGNAANPEPLIIDQLREFRELFEEFRRHVLLTHDMRTAKKIFRTADMLLDEIKDNVILATHELKVLSDKYFSGYDRDDFPDEGLPRLATDGTTTSSQQQKLGEIRAWLSELPEVKRAVNDGFITIDQELRDFLRLGQQEERRVDADDLEFSDMESCSDYEDDNDDEEEEEHVANSQRSCGPLVPASWTHDDA